MATETITPATAPAKLPSGAVTRAVLNWKANGGVRYVPFEAENGAEAASTILLKAHAMIQCLAMAQESASEHPDCEYA
jgi:hypothetical protein